MLYFQNAAAHLTLHSAGSYIQVDWQAGAQPEVLVQQAMNHVLEGLLQQGWQKVLNQQRHKAAFSIELQAWITLDWRPRATGRLPVWGVCAGAGCAGAAGHVELVARALSAVAALPLLCQRNSSAALVRPTASRAIAGRTHASRPKSACSYGRAQQ